MAGASQEAPPEASWATRRPHPATPEASSGHPVVASVFPPSPYGGDGVEGYVSVPMYLCPQDRTGLQLFFCSCNQPGYHCSSTKFEGFRARVSFYR